MRDWENVFSVLQDFVTTPKNRRDLIKAFVPDMVNEGINQTASHNLFRQYGFGIRSSDFADIYNAANDENALFKNIANLDGSEVIDPDFMRINTNLNDRRFRYVANIAYTNSEQERLFLGSYSLASDTNLTIDEIYSQLEDIIAQHYGELYDGIQSIKLQRAYINIPPI